MWPAIWKAAQVEHNKCLCLRTIWTFLKLFLRWLTVRCRNQSIYVFNTLRYHNNISIQLKCLQRTKLAYVQVKCCYVNLFATSTPHSPGIRNKQLWWNFLFIFFVFLFYLAATYYGTFTTLLFSQSVSQSLTHSYIHSFIHSQHNPFTHSQKTM